MIGQATAPASKRLKAPVVLTHTNPWKPLASTEPVHAGVDAQLLSATEPSFDLYMQNYDARGFKDAALERAVLATRPEQGAVLCKLIFSWPAKA